MTDLRLNPGGVQERVHDELSYHRQFIDAHLNYSEENSYEDKLAFYVPNYAGTVDSSTINEICSRLGPLFTMETDARCKRLWIYAHAPGAGALKLLRLRKDRMVFILTSTTWSIPLCIVMTLVSLALMYYTTSRLRDHWSGYDRPWETLVERGREIIQ